MGRLDAWIVIGGVWLASCGGGKSHPAGGDSGNSGAADSMGVGDDAGSISDARVGGTEDGDRFGADGHDGAFLAILPSTSLAFGDIPFAETTARMIVENRGLLLRESWWWCRAKA